MNVVYMRCGCVCEREREVCGCVDGYGGCGVGGVCVCLYFDDFFLIFEFIYVFGF